MQSKSQGYLFLLVVLGLAGLSAWGFLAKKPQFGLDIKGGVRIEYRMKSEELSPAERENFQMIRSNMQTILGNRVGSALGVVEGSVVPKGEESFVVEIPGFKDADKARQILSTTASIEMYHAKTVVTDKPLGQLRTYVPGLDRGEGGRPAVSFSFRTGDRKAIEPGTPEYAQMIKSWELILKGSELQDAYPIAQGNSVIPGLKFNADGARKMEQWSRRYLNQGEMLASVLDGVVLNIAPLADGAIIKDQAEIRGQFEAAYVRQLSDLLKAGSLPVGLEEQSVETVDPTIGEKSLDAIYFAGAISFAVIVIFLIVYYAFPGVVALIALVLYVLFTLTALKLIDATFSLAAIAGFILSIGVAVDANILVFERVKEEIREGRPLIRAVELGFKRALPSIIDSNTCTIITSMVLVNFGTGPVKGFATTLILGVAISFFTAVAVTRSLLVFLVSQGFGNSPKAFALGRNWFGESFETNALEKPLPIMQKTRKWFLISLITILPGAFFIFPMQGLKANVEFTGGYRVTVQLPQGSQIKPNEILSKLETAGYKGSNVSFSTAGGVRYASMTVPAATEKVDTGKEDAIAAAAGFKSEDIRNHARVGASVQKETVRNAVLGVILSSLGIMLYLGIRFGIALGGIRNGIRFGLSAIGAMVHDVLVVVGIAAIMGYFAGWEISALFITAMLTVIGFSVHDTVVVFDRVRENLRKKNLGGATFEHICNVSVSQSYARSINTSLMVIITLGVLMLFGTPTIDLKFFCLAMLVGIVSGTYSSIYNATPILYLWDKAVIRRRGEEAGLVAEAKAAAEAIEHQKLLLQQELGGAITGPGRPASPGAAPKGAANTNPQAGFSQVRRRESAVDRAKRPLDLDDEDDDK